MPQIYNKGGSRPYTTIFRSRIRGRSLFEVAQNCESCWREARCGQNIKKLLREKWKFRTMLGSAFNQREIQIQMQLDKYCHSFRWGFAEESHSWTVEFVDRRKVTCLEISISWNCQTGSRNHFSILQQQRSYFFCTLNNCRSSKLVWASSDWRASNPVQLFASRIHSSQSWSSDYGPAAGCCRFAKKAAATRITGTALQKR